METNEDQLKSGDEKQEEKQMDQNLTEFKKKVVLSCLISLLIIILGYGGWMIKHRMDYAITDAVFVDSEKIVNTGFERVAGRIVNMTKLEGELVSKGEVLAEIDPQNYKLAVRGVRGELEAVKKEKEKLEVTLKRIKEQIRFKVGMAEDRAKGITKEIEALKEMIASLNATIAQLTRDRNRYKKLYKKRAIAKRTFEKIDTELTAREWERDANAKKVAALTTQLMAAKKEVNVAISERKKIKETRKGIEALGERINSLRAKLKDAGLNLEYCRIRSPINGRIAKKYTSVGDVVEAGMPVYALIDPDDIFMLVLLEETKLNGVIPGCPASIRIDAYPGLDYKGEVKEILPASAAKFALVPRDISAGEFTKVVQRMQVKVAIVQGDISRLVVGMGGEIEIKREK